MSQAFKNLTGQGKLTEKNMNDMLKEVRMSLLEADVNYTVVKDFIARVKEKALGEEVLSALNPGQMVVKIVHEEITELLGSEEVEVHYKKSGITTLMMVGLQGTGKTTASAKIANLMKKKHGRRPLLVACDVVRPAAIEQLQTLGESIDVEVFTLGVETKALETARQAMRYAQENGYYMPGQGTSWALMTEGCRQFGEQFLVHSTLRPFTITALVYAKPAAIYLTRTEGPPADLRGSFSPGGKPVPGSCQAAGPFHSGYSDRNTGW